MRHLLAILLLTSTAAFASADWEKATDGLAKKHGAGFGGLCGIAVDRATGHLFLNISDKGIHRSTDHGATFTPFAQTFKGRTEWPGCMMFDPTGRTHRLMVALVYGSPILIGEPDEKTWTAFDKKSTHVDWCVGDWSGTGPTFLLAFKHESGGMLLRSVDGGKSFDEIGKGYASAWVFDAKTAVATRAKTKDQPQPKLVRTTDAGATWTPVGDFASVALPKWNDGKLYWIVESGLIATSDRGATWTKISDMKDAKLGPIFGKNAGSFFVLAKSGILESTDFGKTWAAPIPLPADLKGWSSLTWLDYDPVHDILYTMKMGSELYRLKRGK